MKTYSIQTNSVTEDNIVRKVLMEHDVKDINNGVAITHYSSITFKCKKSTWKNIKRKLNLQVKHVFAEFKVEPQALPFYF